MPIIQKTLTIKWNAKTKEYYENKGYIFTKIKDEFEVQIKDVYPGNKEPVLCQCEYCNEQFKRIFSRAIAIDNKIIYNNNINILINYKFYKLNKIIKEIF